MHPFSSFDKGALPVLRKAIQFTQQRHLAIANNIANAETPNYESQDLDVAGFQKLLSNAVDKRRAGNPRKWDFGRNRSINPRADGGVDFRMLPSKDVDVMQHSRNNVDIDKEMVKLSQNAIMHNAMIQLLSKQYSLIESAIAERVIQ